MNVISTLKRTNVEEETLRILEIKHNALNEGRKSKTFFLPGDV
jgi:hypothetical protein